MIAGILQMLGPIILWFLQKWVENQKAEESMLKSYYNFLDHVDKAGQVKVANHLSATKALRAEQERLRKELEGVNQDQ